MANRSARGVRHIEVIQGAEPAFFREERPDQGTLAGLARSCDYDGGHHAEVVGEPSLQVTGQERAIHAMNDYHS